MKQRTDLQLGVGFLLTCLEESGLEEIVEPNKRTLARGVAERVITYADILKRLSKFKESQEITRRDLAEKAIKRVTIYGLGGLTPDLRRAWEEDVPKYFGETAAAAAIEKYNTHK